MNDFTKRLTKGTLLTAALTLILAWSPAPAQADSVTCRVTVDHYKIVDGTQGQEILADGFGSLLVPGKPKLPRKIFSVAIPPFTRVTSVSVKAVEEVVLDGEYDLMPTPLFRALGEEKPELLARDRKVWHENHRAVYGSDRLYAEEVGEFVQASAYRKYNLVDVSVTPFSYKPLSKRVIFHPEITIEVEYEPVLSGYDLPLNDYHPETENTAMDIVLNYEEAQSWYPAGGGEKGKDQYDFVLITIQDLENAVSGLVAWEEAKGRSCAVVTVEWIDANYAGPDQAARIRAFLREKYPTSQWGIRDVFLVGHHNEVDMRKCSEDAGYGKPRTDFYYAELSKSDQASWDLDGDGLYGESREDAIDFFSEIHVGRIPWSEVDIVQHICDKSVAYEQNNDPAFKKNMLLLGSFFWENTDTAVMMEAKVDQPWMSDWTITRLYEQNSTVYSDYACDYEINRSNTQSVWSGGQFAFTNWAGHGAPESAHLMGYGSQAFVRTSDCAGLNDDYPSIVFADSCSNSDTDSNNIGRRMLNQGAVGFVGATKVAYGSSGWSDPSDGSTQSLDYYFTTGVTSGHYTQGGSLQRALRKLYTDGLWYYNHYEIYEWTLWGNPGLGLNYTGTPAKIPLITALGPWEKNGADVRVFNAREGAFVLSEMQVYGPDKFGANVAFGDLDGDTEGEIVTGPGPGPIYGPHVRAFEINGDVISPVSFFAYGTKKFGVKVATGDLDGDGFSEIITGPGPGVVFGPHVRGWNCDGGQVTPISAINFFAYGTRLFGCNPARGDVDGDGMDEIITGPGPGVVFAPHVRGWDFEGGSLSSMSTISFFAYANKHYGVEVAAGDISDGNCDEIITGPGPGPALGTNVRAFSCEGGRAQPISGVNFIAYPESKYGVVVAAGEATGGGKDEIITSPGPAWENYTHVRGWIFDGSGVTPSEVIDFNAFARSPKGRYGVRLAID